jgi:hypothetical protein
MMRPFKTILKDGRPIRVDPTDEEIAEAQQRTAAEQVERQARQAIEDKHTAMMAYLEQLYDSTTRIR